MLTRKAALALLTKGLFAKASPRIEDAQPPAGAAPQQSFTADNVIQPPPTPTPRR